MLDKLDDEARTTVNQLYEKHLNLEGLREIYRQLVLTTIAVGNQIAERNRMLPGWSDGEISPTTPYPRCQIHRHVVGSEPFSFYQLSYDGMLPLYFSKQAMPKEKKTEITHYLNAIRDSYIQATVDSARLMPTIQDKLSFHDAFIYVCHFYGDLTMRDLDNRNRSILINAARYAGFIQGDEWERLAYMESGFLDIDRKHHVSMFISSRENGLKMAEYVNELQRKGYRFRI